VFFVHTINSDEGWLGGSTSWKGHVDDNRVGIVVAVYDNLTSTKRKTNSEIAKTLAHELTHYLAALGNEGHNAGNSSNGSPKPNWNLFLGGNTGSQIRLDLTDADRTVVDQSPVTPGWSNMNV
jgi:hypothetical protein